MKEMISDVGNTENYVRGKIIDIGDIEDTVHYVGETVRYIGDRIDT